MADERWTDETRELVGRVFDFVEFDLADEVLTTLADAGLLLPPGGETREEWGAVKHSHRPWDFVHRTTAEAARHTAAVWAGDAFPAGRTVTEWPDGTRLVSPWRPVDTEETKP